MFCYEFHLAHSQFESISLSLFHSFHFLTFQTQWFLILCPLIVSQNQPLHMQCQLCFVVDHEWESLENRSSSNSKLEVSKTLIPHESVHGTSLTSWVITISIIEATVSLLSSPSLSLFYFSCGAYMCFSFNLRITHYAFNI